MGRYFLHEATLTLGSLFSGIGGIEIAAEVPYQIYPIFKTIAEIEQNLITRNDSDLIPDKPETYFKVD